MRGVLNSKNQKVDLNKVMTKKCQNLNTKEHKILLNLFRNHRDQFDSMLVTWSTTPLDLDLRNKTNPVFSRPYPVPRVHKAMFRKEVKRLVILLVLEN